MTVGHTESIMIAVVEATEIFYFQFILTFQEITIGFKIITSAKRAALKRGPTYCMKLFSGQMSESLGFASVRAVIHTRTVSSAISTSMMTFK